MTEFINEKLLKKIKGYKRIAAVVLGVLSAYGFMTYEIWITDMDVIPKILTICSQWSTALAAGYGIQGKVDEDQLKKQIEELEGMVREEL